MKLLNLTDEHYVGKGGTKLVYRHPLDPDLCIKFPKPGKKGTARDLKREISYLQKHQDTLSFLAPFLGTIDTQLGQGYLFQMIRDEDGQISQDISIFTEQPAPVDLVEKIAQIYYQALSQKAVINDVKLANILVQKGKNKDYTIYLVDGFGNPDFIKICDYSRFFLKLKLQRKFKRLCHKLGLSDAFLNER